MAILLSTRFLEGDWSPWTATDTHRAAPYQGGFGIDLGPSNTCNWSDSFSPIGGFVKSLPGNGLPAPYPASGWGYTAMVARTQYALYTTLTTSLFASSSNLLFQDGVALGAGANSAPFSGAFRIIPATGSVQLEFNNGVGPSPSTTLYTSSAGVFPLDGTIHGIQFAITNLLPTACDYLVKVDNATVLSGTHTPTAVWGYYPTAHNGDPAFLVPQAGIITFDISHYRSPAALCDNDQNQYPAYARAMTNCAEVVLNDSGATTSYPACNALPIGQWACNGDILNVCTDATTGAMVITGTKFQADTVSFAVVRVSDDVSETFTTTIESDTVATLTGFAPALVDGADYDVSLIGPC